MGDVYQCARACFGGFNLDLGGGMSNSANDGRPAYPAFTENGLNSGISGMTLRDYFAANVLQGLLARGVRAPPAEFATRAYMVADEMLKTRKS